MVTNVSLFSSFSSPLHPNIAREESITTKEINNILIDIMLPPALSKQMYGIEEIHRLNMC
jgi:hypothetical protein